MAARAFSHSRTVLLLVMSFRVNVKRSPLSRLVRTSARPTMLRSLIVTSSAPSSRRPSAYPAACGIWVAIGMQIGPNLDALGSYGPPCHVPR